MADEPRPPDEPTYPSEIPETILMFDDQIDFMLDELARTKEALREPNINCNNLNLDLRRINDEYKKLAFCATELKRLINDPSQYFSRFYDVEEDCALTQVRITHTLLRIGKLRTPFSCVITSNRPADPKLLILDPEIQKGIDAFNEEWENSCKLSKKSANSNEPNSESISNLELECDLESRCETKPVMPKPSMIQATHSEPNHITQIEPNLKESKRVESEPVQAKSRYKIRALINIEYVCASKQNYFANVTYCGRSSYLVSLTRKEI